MTAKRRRRNDFSSNTKEILAKRVAYRCSNPNCRVGTVGPGGAPDKVLMIGIAARISGAAPEGPRYNPELSSEERSRVENGIWLCENCTKLIDSDETCYPSEKLLEWKRQAENECATQFLGLTAKSQNIVTPISSSVTSAGFDHRFGQQPRHFRIFLASPGDTTEERALAGSVIEQIRGERAFRSLVNVECIAWDQPGVAVAMEATITPQEAIARGLPKPSECDLVVVILWSRIGTPLPPEYVKPDDTRYLSGTEWEYCDAVEAARQSRRPSVWLYHRIEVPHLPIDDPDYDEKRDQWHKLQTFLKRLRNEDGSIEGGINCYEKSDEFKRIFEHHLRDRLTQDLQDLQDEYSVSKLTTTKISGQDDDRRSSASSAILASALDEIGRFSSSEAANRLESLIEKWREGDPCPLATWITEIRSNQAMWRVLPRVLQARMLRQTALLELDRTGNTKIALQLLDEARDINPADDQIRARALVAYKTTGVGAALECIGNSANFATINLKAAFLLDKGQIDEILNLLATEDVQPSATDSHALRAERYRLQAAWFKNPGFRVTQA